jgi:hypothetical protein
MYQALFSISGDDKIFGATWESIFFHFTPLRDGNAREIGATREKTIPNLSNSLILFCSFVTY